MARKKGQTRKNRTENPDFAAAMREKGRSSAVSPHQDSRTKRERSRSAARDAAIRKDLH